MVSSVKICSPRFPLSSDREAVPQASLAEQAQQALCD